MREKFKNLLETKPWAAYTFAACSAAVLYFILCNLSFVGKLIDYTGPVIWGLLFAYMMNPLVNKIEALFKKLKNEKIRHLLSVVLAVVLVVFVITLLVITLIPSIGESIASIVDNVDNYAVVLRRYLDNFSDVAQKYHINVSKITEAGEQMIQKLMNFITDNANTIASTFVSVGASIANIGIGIVLAVYFMLDKKNLVGSINKLRSLLMSKETYESRNAFWSRCHSILTKFITYDIIEGIIIGVINMIFMFACGMQNVALVSVIVGVTNLLPTFGPIIGAGVGGLLLVLTSPIDALAFLIFTIILQTFDASILKPKLFGDSFGVPAVWIFIAIVVGGKMFGVVGILLAIPFTAIATYVLTELVIPHLEKRKKDVPSETEIDKNKSE